MGPPCFPESCRLVQGSKTADHIITSEQRTERFQPVDCADLCPLPHRRVPPPGAEQEWYRRGNDAFVSYYGDKGVFLSTHQLSIPPVIVTGFAGLYPAPQ